MILILKLLICLFLSCACLDRSAAQSARQKQAEVGQPVEVEGSSFSIPFNSQLLAMRILNFKSWNDSMYHKFDIVPRKKKTLWTEEDISEYQCERYIYSYVCRKQCRLKIRKQFFHTRCWRGGTKCAICPDRLDLDCFLKLSLSLNYISFINNLMYAWYLALLISADISR